jgi:hypothetical protein
MKKILLLCLLILISCVKDPVVDSETDETFKNSMEEIRKSLETNDKKKLDDAIKMILFSGLDLKAIFSGGGNVEDFKKKNMEKLNGKNAKQIIAEGDKLLNTRKKKEKEQAVKEISELEAKKLKSEKDKVSLKAIKVVKSRFYKKKSTYTVNPIIEVTVKNGTKHSISRMYFAGTLASKGRKVPWLKEDFNYEISGGVEPGETKSWTLAPNSFSKWGQVKIEKDAVFTVEVTGADDHTKKSLFSSRGYSSKDESRLEKLKSQYK